MALHISHDLARLIRDRAYTAGAVEKSARKVEALRAELAIAEMRYAKDTSSLAEIDLRLKEFPTIRPARIRAIKATPRRMKLAHGAFTREMVRYLREAKRPVSTYELRSHLSKVFGIEEGITAIEREWLRDKVARRLRRIADKGVLQRIHDPNTNSFGIWLWIGR